MKGKKNVLNFKITNAVEKRQANEGGNTPHSPLAKHDMVRRTRGTSPLSSIDIRKDGCAPPIPVVVWWCKKR